MKSQLILFQVLLITIIMIHKPTPIFADCETTLNSCIKKDMLMVQNDDPNSPNIMCCRAALMTDCLIKRDAASECRGVAGYEEVPNRLKRSLVDPSEVFKIQAMLQPLAQAGGFPGRSRNLKRAPTDFSPSDCKDFKFIDGRLSARCETAVKLIPEKIMSRLRR